MVLSEICDCVLERLKKQEDELQKIREVIDEIWELCFDRDGCTVRIATNPLVEKLQRCYKILNGAKEVP